MSEINTVVQGLYNGCKIKRGNFLSIHSKSGLDMDTIYTKTVKSYTVLTEEDKKEYSFLKGALGVAFLGGFGAVAGIDGKKKTTYLIVINWKNGYDSVICIDKDNYETLIKSMLIKF
ncbi:hypothetical protein GPK90_04660 [Clostridium sp. MCC344]|nr:hypothetical protein [Clostridium sp. MCC344]MBT9788637.1 hypothetical protein [Clostridium sp. MCC344]